MIHGFDVSAVAFGILIATVAMTVLPALRDWWVRTALPWLRWWLSRPTLERTDSYPEFIDALHRWRLRRP